MGLPIAAMMYSLREELAQDYAATVRRVGQMGYDGAEFFGTCPLKAEELKTLLEESGLTCAGWHIELNDFRTDYDAAVSFHKTIGNRFLTIPCWHFEDRAAFDQHVAMVKEWGPRLLADGFVLAYHNHNHEFEKMDGTYVLDRFYEACADILCLQLDVYWVQMGGENPTDYFLRHKEAVRQLHMKDGFAGNELTALGQGSVDIASIANAAKDSKVEWLIIENDHPKPDGFTNMAESLSYLKTLV